MKTILIFNKGSASFASNPSVMNVTNDDEKTVNLANVFVVT